MEKNDIFKIINQFLAEQMLVNSTLGKFQGDFKQSYDIIKKDIELLEADKNFVSNTKDHDIIKRTIRSARNILMEVPISPNVSQFFKCWSELVINWNNNTIKENELGKKSMFVIRMIDQHYTVVEAIDVLKVLNKKFRDSKNWMPPAFEIAPHYLNYLDE